MRSLCRPPRELRLESAIARCAFRCASMTACRPEVSLPNTPAYEMRLQSTIATSHSRLRRPSPSCLLIREHSTNEPVLHPLVRSPCAQRDSPTAPIMTPTIPSDHATTCMMAGLTFHYEFKPLPRRAKHTILPRKIGHRPLLLLVPLKRFAHSFLERRELEAQLQPHAVGSYGDWWDVEVRTEIERRREHAAARLPDACARNMGQLDRLAGDSGQEPNEIDLRHRRIVREVVRVADRRVGLRR